MDKALFEMHIVNIQACKNDSNPFVADVKYLETEKRRYFESTHIPNSLRDAIQ